SGGHVVDLLPGALSDVADVEVAGAAVDAAAPGIAQPLGPDLVLGRRREEERIRGRRLEGQGAVHVEAQDLSVARGVALRVADQRVVAGPRVAGSAAVADRDVEVAVEAEAEPAAVVGEA